MREALRPPQGRRPESGRRPVRQEVSLSTNDDHFQELPRDQRAHRTTPARHTAGNRRLPLARGLAAPVSVLLPHGRLKYGNEEYIYQYYRVR